MRGKSFEGGCLCGEVRFRASGEPRTPCICHCRSCRLASGAPFMAWATFAADGFALTRGEPSFHRSSPSVRRGFCGQCGTALTWAHASRAGELDVSIAALDDPGAIAPDLHIWVSHKLPWVALGDGLPQHPEFREREGD